jgi:hypothetical protein
VLQGELHVAIVVAESRAVVVAERDANITFIRTLEDDTAASVALAQSRTVMDDTIRAF